MVSIGTVENTQLKKGALELCVLALVSKQDYYGYELVHHISQYIEISEGTIYPLLRRLTKEGYFTTYLAESQEGPPRKYYRLTEEGGRYHGRMVQEWESFVKSVNAIVHGGGTT